MSFSSRMSPPDSFTTRCSNREIIASKSLRSASVITGTGISTGTCSGAATADFG